MELMAVNYAKDSDSDAGKAACLLIYTLSLLEQR
jgi:hypothetical protein